MKKAFLLAVIAVLGVAAMAQASTVSFSWGANFNQFSNSEISSSNGSATSLNWYADDFGYGVRTESNTLTGDGTSADTLNVTEITVDKWLSKAVFVGLGIGSASLNTADSSGVSLFENSGTYAAFDVRGGVQLLSGKGEKVNASLDFLIAARFINTPGQSFDFTGNPVANLNSTVAELAVTLGL